MQNKQLAEQSWHNQSFHAMGCTMRAWLDSEDEQAAAMALYQVVKLFQVAEARMSRFQATSELSALNRQSGQWVALSAPLWAVVTLALRLAEQTDGLFDPTLLNALTAAGYTADFATLQAGVVAPHHRPTHRQHRIHYDPTEHNEPARGRWREVQVDVARHAIRVPPGVQLDLGGIGKGFVAQQAVTLLSHWGPCLVDAGGDLVAGDAPRGLPGWSVAIAAPTGEIESPSVNMSASDNEPSDLALLWLKNATLATSGIDYRHWQQEGELRHHLIDPRTGYPGQSDLFTVSVLAADAVVAEAWATALFIAGGTDMQAQGQPRIAAAFVDRQQRLTVTPALYPFLQSSSLNATQRERA